MKLAESSLLVILRKILKDPNHIEMQRLNLVASMGTGGSTERAGGSGVLMFLLNVCRWV
jgi:hypothetical protein